MREEFVDLWQVPVDAVCVTTNGAITKAGRGVMGRGCAAQAKGMFSGIERTLGEGLRRNGNHVQVLRRVNVPGGPIGVPLVAFPVKEHWADDADLLLIAQSCEELMDLVEREGWGQVALPRPGCGNGRLEWPVVKRVIEPLLDDRVVVVARPNER